MKIRTVRVPRDLRQLTLIGLKFYEEVFFDARTRNRVQEVVVEFRRFGHNDHIARCDYELDGNRLPTHFMIEFNTAFRDIKVSHYAKTLFHEMTHVRQYATGQLKYRNGYNIWKGERFADDYNYFESPWEQEAFGVEACAWNRFLQDHPEYKIHARTPRYLGRSGEG